MIKRIKFYIAALSLLFGVVGAAAVSVPALAASPQQTVCSTLGAGNGCGGKPTNGIALNGVVTATIDILSSVVGIAAVIMIIVGGIRFVTSNGDSSKVSAARNTVLYAIIGLVIVAAAQFIVQFVLHRI